MDIPDRCRTIYDATDKVEVAWRLANCFPRDYLFVKAHDIRVITRNEEDSDSDGERAKREEWRAESRLFNDRESNIKW
jgi:hypothetical protein